MKDLNYSQTSRSYFTRSKVATTFKAAGVLPFAVHSGQVLVLIGAEPTRTGPAGRFERLLWRDFGGQREAIDDDVEACAGREFAEETLGIFGGCGVNASTVAASACTMADQLRRSFASLHVVHRLKKGEYHMFCAQTNYIDPLMFYLAIEQNERTRAVPGAEKTAFAWVCLQDLLSAVATSSKRYHVHNNTAIRGMGVSKKLWPKGSRRLQLHPCFAKSLRLAQEAGLVHLTSGVRALPLPPPPPINRSSSSSQREGDGDCSHPPVSDDMNRTGLSPNRLLYWTNQNIIAAALQCASNKGSAEAVEENALGS
eukprot:jgi/Botrbrau1/12509/Bobra.0169s0051.1